MRTRRTLLVVGTILAAAVLAVGLYLFQPWRLWTTTVVDEVLPPTPSTPAASPSTSPTEEPTSTPAAPAEPQYLDLAAGTFITHEHTTTGSVRIVQQPDGSRVLAIDNLMTSDGPDLHVWLTDQPVVEGIDGWGVFDDGVYVELGALKGNVGNQIYPIPADVDLTQLRSVSIWCARFTVSFGAAELTSS